MLTRQARALGALVACAALGSAGCADRDRTFAPVGSPVPDGGKHGCERVDFLFVIDGSVSMSNEQDELIASFPSFVQTIEETLTEVTDFHIMVVDTDAWNRCTAENCATGAQDADTLCNKGLEDDACAVALDDCDVTLGAGVVHPVGAGASNELCTPFGGNRYLVEGEPDVAGTFSCLAQIGTAGAPKERPMDAMVAALADEIEGPGGCNAGFLRDDAVLVVTFISDDPNREDTGEPQDWYDAVLGAKQGRKDAVVVLGLTPAFEGCGPDDQPDKGKHWHEFVSLWGDSGLEASVCSKSYGAFFSQSVPLIDQACQALVPAR
jgi:hypothetical protein